jgi:hypothetical protein
MWSITPFLKPTLDIRVIKELAGNLTLMGEIRGTYRILVVNPEGNGSL